MDGLTSHLKETELLEGDEMVTDLQETPDSQSKRKRAHWQLQERIDF